MILKSESALFEYLKSSPGSRIQDVKVFWFKTEIKIIVFDCVVCPDPNFLIFKTKKMATFITELEAALFDPMLTCKGFATNSLKLEFL